MSEPDHQNLGAGERSLDRLLDRARTSPVPPLSSDLMRRLLADAATAQPARPVIAPAAPRPGFLSTLWQGLEQAFGGVPGLAGAGLATCVAFGLGVFLPDTTRYLVGLSTVFEVAEVDLAAYQLTADPSLLWAEE
jgi:hypothetical protein